MKTLFKTALIIAAITSAIHAQEGQLRLAPSEINSLASVNAGAGTSRVSGIQTRTLKGDASKLGMYTIQLTIPAGVRIQAHTHPDDVPRSRNNGGHAIEQSHGASIGEWARAHFS